MYVPKENTKQFAAPALDTIEGVVQGTEIKKPAEELPEPVAEMLKEEPVVEEKQEKSIAEQFVSYVSETVSDSYKELSKQLTKSYCILRKKVKSFFGIKNMGDSKKNIVNSSKAKQLDWYCILPRVGDPRRDMYMQLL